MVEEAMQGANLHSRSNGGYSVLLKETSTWSLEEPGIQPAAFQLLDNDYTSWAKEEKV